MKDEDRFVIFDEGIPLMQFQSEVHIKDTLDNEDCAIIIIRSGYGDLEPTQLLAKQILKLLNDGNRARQ